MAISETKKLINTHFGQNWKGENISLPVLTTLGKNEKRENLIEKPDAVQSAIRIGRILFNKTHADYFGMQVLKMSKRH